MAKSEYTQPAFRTAYSKPLKVALVCPPEEGRTKPEFKKDCDINQIMKRYNNDVKQIPWDEASARYGDFTQIPDFMEMQQRVIAAQDLFMALPASVRKQFDNDPGLFLAAAETPDGIDLIEKLGLKMRKEPKGAPPEAPKADDKSSAPSVSVKKDEGGNKSTP